MINNMELIEKYISEGISIQGNPRDGYMVFTILTQHFRVASLSELTPERFELAAREWRELEEMQDSAMAEFSRRYFHSTHTDPSEYLKIEYKNKEQ